MSLNLTKSSQEILIAHTLKNHPATTVLLSIINVDDWCSSEFSDIWSIIKDHWTKYKVVPTRATLMEAVDSSLIPLLLKLYTISDLDSVASLIDRAVSFIKAKRLQDLVRSVDNTLETNPELAEHTLRKGLAGMPAPLYNSSSLQDMLPDSIFNYEDNRLGMPTGLSVLDRAVGGGMGLGEVFIIASPSGGGKSSLLSLICTNVAMTVPCLYITLELTAARVTRLLSARIARIKQSELSDSMEAKDFIKLRQRVSKMYPIEISYYPSETVTVAQIGGMIEYMRQVKGINVQAVFIDYADHMATTRVAKNSPKWEKIASIYQELVDLGKVFNVTIFTASQLKNNEAIRSGVAESIESGDIAGSIEKINKVDVAIAWKPLEVVSGKADGILSFIKVREGEKPPTWRCTFDYDTLSFKFVHPFQAASETGMVGSSNRGILNRL